MTSVVNVKKSKYDVFIGRPSIFGNPFVLKREEDREKVVAQYEKYARKRIEEDVNFAIAVANLEGRTLGCFCAPRACHGDVLVTLTQELKGKYK